MILPAYSLKSPNLSNFTFLLLRGEGRPHTTLRHIKLTQIDFSDKLTACFGSDNLRNCPPGNCSLSVLRRVGLAERRTGPADHRIPDRIGPAGHRSPAVPLVYHRFDNLPSCNMGR